MPTSPSARAPPCTTAAARRRAASRRCASRGPPHSDAGVRTAMPASSCYGRSADCSRAWRKMDRFYLDGRTWKVDYAVKVRCRRPLAPHALSAAAAVVAAPLPRSGLVGDG
eukprot:scaffold1508_cov320-Prasinococcus_capsulatus_cf.AAC.5